ncbi:MAG: septum formation initiator family protein [Xanthobacteraceae bacterium]|uniref:FtsB family cell division protein n=1 Tax=Pseudolabrys sp. TaxID=1960880 RepID=UPI003D0DA356
MVTHRRRRTILTALALYTLAALLIGYFGVNAFTGKRGLRAQHLLEQQTDTMTAELGRLKAERQYWQKRVALLRSSQIDPDMLDERARAMLDFTDPRDVVMWRR